MHIRSRTIRVLTAAALTAGGLTAATTASATAAPVVVQSCLGSARSFSTTPVGQYSRWPASGSVTATSNCADINIKGTYGSDVRTCFLPSGGGTSCNSWRYIGSEWGLAATAVKDGTKFYLEFADGYDYGSVAY